MAAIGRRDSRTAERWTFQQWGGECEASEQVGAIPNDSLETRIAQCAAAARREKREHRASRGFKPAEGGEDSGTAATTLRCIDGLAKACRVTAVRSVTRDMRAEQKRGKVRRSDCHIANRYRKRVGPVRASRCDSRFSDALALSRCASLLQRRRLRRSESIRAGGAAAHRKPQRG